MILIKRNKEAADTAASKALPAMHKVLTGLFVTGKRNYINFSLNQRKAEHAPEALPVMQQIDTLCPNRRAGSTPAWSGSATFTQPEDVCT